MGRLVGWSGDPRDYRHRRLSCDCMKGSRTPTVTNGTRHPSRRLISSGNFTDRSAHLGDGQRQLGALEQDRAAPETLYVAPWLNPRSRKIPCDGSTSRSRAVDSTAGHAALPASRLQGRQATKRSLEARGLAEASALSSGSSVHSVSHHE